MQSDPPARICGNRPHVWRVPPGITFDEWGACEYVVCGYCGLRMKRTEARHADGGLVSEPVKTVVTHPDIGDIDA